MISSAPRPAVNRFTSVSPGLALALAGATLFSAKAIFIKLAYRHGVDAVTLIALRMAFAAPLFALAWWWSSRDAPALAAADHARVVVLGLLGYYAASFLDFLGLQYISAGLERLILYLTPTLVLLLSVVWLRRRVARVELAALALSYAGIVLAFWHDVRVEGGRVALGSALVFVSAVCYAIYLVVSGELVRRVGAIRLTAYAMCVSTAACLIQFALINPWSALVQPAQVYGLMAATALFSTVLPVFATMMAVARIGAARTALAGTIGPVATIALAFVFLGEAVSGWQLAGTTLVLAGILVLSRAGAAPPAAD